MPFALSGRYIQTALEGWITRQWLHRHGWAWLSWPLSFVYGLAVAQHQRHYQRHPEQVKRLPVPVIVIGNLIAGGAGKTPVCLALIQHLKQQGWMPGIVSRGYGRSTASSNCLEVEADTPAVLCGDEPLLLKQRSHVPVMVGKNRSEVGLALLRQHPEVNIIVLDDGLQHRQLHADIRVVVFDERGLGNGWLLPAGLLREPWPTSTYATDFVVRPSVVYPADATPSRTENGLGRLMAALDRAHPFGIFSVQRTLSSMVVGPCGEQSPLDSLCHLPSLALAGIAKPQQFFTMLEQQGVLLEKTIALTDHASMVGIDFESLRAYPQWFITEKDSVKLFPAWKEIKDALSKADPTLPLPQLWSVRLELSIEPHFFTVIDKKLSSLHGHSTS